MGTLVSAFVHLQMQLANHQRPSPQKQLNKQKYADQEVHEVPFFFKSNIRT